MMKFKHFPYTLQIVLKNVLKRKTRNVRLVMKITRLKTSVYHSSVINPHTSFPHPPPLLDFILYDSPPTTL